MRDSLFARLHFQIWPWLTRPLARGVIGRHLPISSLRQPELHHFGRHYGELPIRNLKLMRRAFGVHSVVGQRGNPGGFAICRSRGRGIKALVYLEGATSVRCRPISQRVETHGVLVCRHCVTEPGWRGGSLVVRDRLMRLVVSVLFPHKLTVAYHIVPSRWH